MTPEKLVRSLPKSIRVGGYDVRIALMSRLDSECASVYGLFWPAKQLIELETGFASKEKVVETFLHEVTHAIYWVAGIKDEDGEERTVTAMAKVWMQIFKDNDWLAPWIKRALK